MTTSHAHEHDQRRDQAGPGEDQLYLLTLCLELQLDLLLVALRPDGAAPTLDLTGETPVVTRTTTVSGSPDRAASDTAPDPATGAPSTAVEHRRSWLNARYAAIVDAVEEMLENSEIRRHPAVLARLEEARSTCEARLTTLPGRVPAQTAPTTPMAGLDLPGAPDDVPRVEAGHFLG
jgi:hypothetical protein